MKAQDNVDLVIVGDWKSLRYRTETHGEGELLFKDGGDRTLLHWAVDSNQMEVAEYLLSMKIDVNAVDLTGSTPLDYLHHLYKQDLDTYPDFLPSLHKGFTEQRKNNQETFQKFENLLKSHGAKKGSSVVYSSIKKEDKAPVHQPTEPTVKEDSLFWKQTRAYQGNKAVLPDGLLWAELESPTSFNKEAVGVVIEEVKNLTQFDASKEGLNMFTGFEFVASLELLESYLSLATSWVGIRNETSGELVGFIAATRFDLSFDKKRFPFISKEHMPCLEVHSLVLHPDWRGKYLTPILVTKLYQTCSHLKIDNGFFTTTSKLPLRPTSVVPVYTRLLNPQILKRTPFFPYTRSQGYSMSEITRLFTVKESTSGECSLYKREDKDQVFTLWKEYLTLFPLRRQITKGECNKLDVTKDVSVRSVSQKTQYTVL